MPSLERDGDVFVLQLGDGESRFNPSSLDELEAALDEVEAHDGPKALVTAASGKIWSNGLDLEWMGAHQDEALAMVGRVQHLYARLLGGDLLTVAAIQGHAFAAGAMLALAHDVRVMREDRGWWCLPEADLGIPFTPGMNDLIAARLSPPVAHRAMVTAHRFTGPEALTAGAVDALAAEDAVLASAVELAAARADKPAAALGQIKRRLHATALASLREPLAGFSTG